MISHILQTRGERVDDCLSIVTTRKHNGTIGAPQGGRYPPCREDERFFRDLINRVIVTSVEVIYFLKMK
jgi:hypothetical protein